MKYLVAAFIFAILVASFALQNALPVTVSFLLWNMQTSVVLVVLGAASFGALMVLSLALLMRFQLLRKTKRLERQVTQLDQENQLLRQRLTEKERAEQNQQPATEGQTDTAAGGAHYG